ncbi:MAG: hypothetical protein K2X66_04070, partial [Cyanobacteria bacterium]|nr:hypothetical protein [Cyanobacteriota bacterium]
MTRPTNRIHSQLIPPSYLPQSSMVGRNHVGNAPKFQGYRLAENGEASLFLPGYWDPQDSFKYKVKAVIVPPGQSSAGKEVNNTHTVPLSRKGHYWVSDQTVPLGSLYRIQVEETYHDKPLDVIDNLQVKKIGSQVFNVVSPFEKSSPQKSVVMADIFQDSVVSRKKLLAYLEA